MTNKTSSKASIVQIISLNEGYIYIYKGLRTSVFSKIHVTHGK